MLMGSRAISAKPPHMLINSCIANAELEVADLASIVFVLYRYATVYDNTLLCYAFAQYNCSYMIPPHLPLWPDFSERPFPL